MLKIEIKTPLMAECALVGIKELAKSFEISVETLANLDDSVKAILEMKVENAENLIQKLPELCIGFKISKTTAKVLLKEHPCLIAPVFLRSGALITKMRVEDSELIWSIVCDDESFLKLMEALESAEIEYEIIYKGRLESEDTITLREEEILKIALQKGFFDYPRKIRLEELAKQLGMAPSTLSEIMRRGQKKILQKFFE
ncbi:MAG: helix-turn-helix domain-containing protein [Archaeoglobales archaeon]|nr:helix-turn-helix domain-containing protein [Archaeoglobales archaeon]